MDAEERGGTVCRRNGLALSSSGTQGLDLRVPELKMAASEGDRRTSSSSTFAGSSSFRMSFRAR